jgi:hypothetical protein
MMNDDCPFKVTDEQKRVKNKSDSKITMERNNDDESSQKF